MRQPPQQQPQADGTGFTQQQAGTGMKTGMSEQSRSAHKSFAHRTATKQKLYGSVRNPAMMQHKDTTTKARPAGGNTH